MAIRWILTIIAILGISIIMDKRIDKEEAIEMKKKPLGLSALEVD